MRFGMQFGTGHTGLLNRNTVIRSRPLDAIFNIKRATLRVYVSALDRLTLWQRTEIHENRSPVRCFEALVGMQVAH